MAVLVADTFTDANGTSLVSHTPDTGGGAWVIDYNVAPYGGTPSTPQIFTNALDEEHNNVQFAAGLAHLTKSGGYGTNDYTATLPITFANTDAIKEPFVAVRISGSTHYSFGYYRAGSWELRKHYATFSNLDLGYWPLAGATAPDNTSIAGSSHTLALRVLTHPISGKPVFTGIVDGVTVLTYTDNDYGGAAYSTGLSGVWWVSWSGYQPPSGIFATSISTETIPTGAFKIAISTEAAGATPGVAFGTQPVIETQTAYDAVQTGFADTITVSKVSGPGTLSGTLSQAVNVGTGHATFTDLVLSASGTYVLRFTSTNGLGTVDQTLIVASATAHFSATMLGAALDTTGMAIFNGGATIEIRDGTIPANTGVAATGTLGATIVLPAVGTTTFTAPVGTVTANPPAKVLGVASITPTWARVKKSDGTVLMDLTCGVGQILSLSNPTISVGTRVQLEVLTWRDDSGVVTLSTEVRGWCAIGGTTVGGVVELPRVTVSSAYTSPTGTIRTVGPGKMYSSSQLQQAINDAVYGDKIVIDNGLTIDAPDGGFVLPYKVPSGVTPHPFIYIEAATLPCLEGVQTSPSLMAIVSAPKIRQGATGYAMSTDDAAHHWRLTGLEFCPGPSAPALTFGLVWMGPVSGSGAQGDTYADMPSYVTIDRCYIHGDSTHDILHGVGMQCDYMALVDSYLSEFHYEFNDTTGISSWMCNGPLKIQHNYIEALTENLLFGGAEPLHPNVCLADVEIRANTFIKDPTWVGVRNNIKTLLELKIGKRILIEGNIFRNNWMTNTGWGGPTITLKAVNQNFTASAGHVTTCDITIRNNRIDHTGCALNFHPHSEVTKPITAAARLYVGNNLISEMGATPADTVGTFNDMIRVGASSIACWPDFILEHNTFAARRLFSVMLNGDNGQVKNARHILRNNIFCTGRDFPIYGDSFGYVDENLAAYWASDCEMSHNVFVTGVTEPGGTPVSPVAVNNRWLTFDGNFSFPSIGFTDIAIGDYSLIASSIHKGYATDGSDPGVNMAALLGDITDPLPTPIPPEAGGEPAITTIRTYDQFVEENQRRRAAEAAFVNEAHGFVPTTIGSDFPTATHAALAELLNVWKLAQAQSALVYSTSITPVARVARWYVITVTNTTAFTIQAPSNVPKTSEEQDLEFTIRNSSGGVMGSITWNSIYHLAGTFTNPANGYSRSIRFRWSGGVYVEMSRTMGDVLN